ncbi:MAG: beta-ketoacyl-ACP synthase II [Clostridiales bacterium]|nr:beta-ketoacyl-ACP synthase II [Clostridiales bacterium]
MKRRVVVTGIGAITPIGNNVPAYFEGLKNGKNGIAPISRFDASDLKCKVCAEVKEFDPSSCFNTLARNKTDLYVQYAVCAAQEAMDDSGLLGHIDENELGVYVGSGVGGIVTICDEQNKITQNGPKVVSPHFVPKMIINMAAGQIAIRFHAHGPAMSMATACATGSTAIGEAYRSIRDGYLTANICGGSEAAVNPLAMAGFVNCMALSQSPDPNAASLPFDSRRGGFVLGEGAAILILEEYEHARQRGAHIYAEICGYGATCDAHHITAPDPEATQTIRAIEQAMEGVDYDPSKTYINAHGTGTKLNDKVETQAFKAYFKENADKLHISSTKSMTGHMLGAAGAAEAIACILALQEGIVPPTINLTSPDPELDLDYTPNTACHTEIDTAISTSLGFGGHNACLAFKKVNA